MSGKGNVGTDEGPKDKENSKVMPFNKVEVLDKLYRCHYGVKSTICFIKKNGYEIRGSINTNAPSNANVFLCKSRPLPKKDGKGIVWMAGRQNTGRTARKWC
jgi:hypothetical protein